VDGYFDQPVLRAGQEVARRRGATIFSLRLEWSPRQGDVHNAVHHVGSVLFWETGIVTNCRENSEVAGSDFIRVFTRIHACRCRPHHRRRLGTGGVLLSDWTGGVVVADGESTRIVLALQYLCGAGRSQQLWTAADQARSQKGGAIWTLARKVIG
jgi:hypothetical protein